MNDQIRQKIVSGLFHVPFDNFPTVNIIQQARTEDKSTVQKLEISTQNQGTELVDDSQQLA